MGYWYGSYGLIRGYGPLCRTVEEADRSARRDAIEQRRHGGSTDRVAVAVCRRTGLCWWAVDEDIREVELAPVRTIAGEQARYPMVQVEAANARWGERLAGGMG